MGFLVKHDGSATAPLILLSIGIPLLSAGHYRYTHRGYQESSNKWVLVSGLAIILLGCTLCLLAAASAVNYFVRKAKKSQSSEYDWIDDKSTTPEAILNYLQDVTKLSSSTTTTTTTTPLTPCLRCLAALTSKISSKKSSKKSSKRSKLEITCLEASYLILKSFPLSDAAISSSILLLALIAKNNQVRRQHANDNTCFGLDIPIAALRLSLQRAKLDEDEDEDKEHTMAELQRRGCLFLGAVADGDGDSNGGTGCGLAKMIADRGGLDMALDAVGWYRYHEDVANWALWAVFILCYDHVENQDKLVQLDGIPKICKVMKDHPKSMGVQRHGIAILFDLMREREMGVATATATAMVMNKHQIRMMALSADLHSLVKTAMEHHDDKPEIMMMGRQMLVATGYTGDIPKWKGTG